MEVCERPGEPTKTGIRHADRDVGRVDNQRTCDRDSTGEDTECCRDNCGTGFQVPHSKQSFLWDVRYERQRDVVKFLEKTNQSVVRHAAISISALQHWQHHYERQEAAHSPEGPFGCF